ncbi:MAG TPA: serine hydrolase [Candidatus Dormibacteraeota bacterium]|nr:serine hydrolase [Candidatus Dormibacteraeota bacterium]
MPVLAPSPSLAAAADPTAAPLAAPLIIGVRQRGSLDTLASRVVAIQQASGAGVAVAIIELGGLQPEAWSVNGDQQFVAASTYKLPILMAEAQLVAERPSAASDQLCYVDADWEDGWYQDYQNGTCFTRATLSLRVGQTSDNTAGHILVRYLGGTGALNAYAQAHGASESAFYVPNVTTANDLSRLMADEARGGAGGVASQTWLYPLLTLTAFENGLPAGVGPGATVVHKVGTIDMVSSDVGLITGSPNGAYVLAVCTSGLGGDAGMALVAQVSAAVWQFESNER